MKGLENGNGSVELWLENTLIRQNIMTTKCDANDNDFFYQGTKKMFQNHVNKIDTDQLLRPNCQVKSTLII